MPVIDMPVDLLLKRVNHGAKGPPISSDLLAQRLPLMGCALEEFAETRQYLCQLCGKIFDRTEAQGPPLTCSHCGNDFRKRGDTLGDLGSCHVMRLDMLAVRPDLFDPGGMARFVRGYLGIDTGLRRYPVSGPRIRVKVDPRLSQESSLRPCISCAVLRGVKLDHALIKMLMNLQEDLHWALGRDRKLASIGVYDLDTLHGSEFHYDAVLPDELSFVPLGFPPGSPASQITPRQVLEQHGTGQAYAHLLKGFERFPVLRDGKGTVLSMPPIINSESTRVTMKSTQLFVDVTGLSQRSVDRALNVLVTSLWEIIPNLEIEAVTIDDPIGPRVTPALEPIPMTLDVARVCDTIGVRLEVDQICQLLERMGHGVTRLSDDGRTMDILVPAYRNDVMHPIDLIEDIAVAYGYENLPAQIVPTFTVGAPRWIEEQAAIARRILTGLGFHQVMTLVLSNDAAAFEKWGLPPDPHAVRIDNPISAEQTIARVSLLPGLLETLSINKQYDLPQQIFEVGDCCFYDPQAETGAREERMVAAAMIGTHVGYADIRAIADAFAHEAGAAFEVRPIEHPGFLPGRVAGLFLADGPSIGLIGELHPRVMEQYGLRHPIAALELSLERLLAP